MTRFYVLATLFHRRAGANPPFTTGLKHSTERPTFEPRKFSRGFWLLNIETR